MTAQFMPQDIQRLMFEHIVSDAEHTRKIQRLLHPTPAGATYWHGPVAPAADEHEVIERVAETIGGFDADYYHDEMLAAIHDAGWKLVKNDGDVHL